MSDRDQLVRTAVKRHFVEWAYNEKVENALCLGTTYERSVDLLIEKVRFARRAVEAERRLALITTAQKLDPILKFVKTDLAHEWLQTIDLAVPKGCRDAWKQLGHVSMELTLIPFRTRKLKKINLMGENVNRF